VEEYPAPEMGLGIGANILWWIYDSEVASRTRMENELLEHEEDILNLAGEAENRNRVRADCLADYGLKDAMWRIVWIDVPSP
jgi:hypothetical protein